MRFQVELQGQSGLPEDVAVNVLYFGGEQVGEGTADGIADVYSDNAGGINSYWNGGLTITWYPDAGGQPLGSKQYALSPSGGTGPTEVALCLSYATVDDVDASTPRRRGRIYLPFTGTTLRPSEQLCQDVVEFGQALAQIGFASGTTWQMRSRADNANFKIESVWCDNSWDTQRRRGVAPTQRYDGDVQ